MANISYEESAKVAYQARSQHQCILRGANDEAVTDVMCQQLLTCCVIRTMLFFVQLDQFQFHLGHVTRLGTLLPLCSQLCAVTYIQVIIFYRPRHSLHWPQC